MNHIFIKVLLFTLLIKREAEDVILGNKIFLSSY